MINIFEANMLEIIDTRLYSNFSSATIDGYGQPLIIEVHQEDGGQTTKVIIRAKE